MIEVVFIGSHFYWESGTMMSPIYLRKAKGLTRYDWGKMQIALGQGEEVHIRQATPQEQAKCDELLAYYKTARLGVEQGKGNTW